VGAFGEFIADYFWTQRSTDREGAFSEGNKQQCSMVAGDDMEGAAFCTPFDKFARHLSVGLNYVVDTYVECEAIEIQGHASCIATREGRDSAVYAGLYDAAFAYDIDLPEKILVPATPTSTKITTATTVLTR